MKQENNVVIWTYMRQNSLGFLGLFLGIAGILLSVYFYRESIAEREPVFLVDPVRAEIIRAGKVADKPITVVRKTGEQIQGDVTAARIYFWNRGKLAIRTQNILQPLIVSLAGEGSEILDFRILKASRDVVKPAIQRDNTNPQRSLRLAFDILEIGDGFSMQLIYVGDPEVKLSLAGAIEGVKSLTESSLPSRAEFWKALLKKLSLIVLFLIGIAIWVFLTQRFDNWLDAFIHKARRTAIVAAIFLAVVAVGIVLALLIAIPVAAIQDAKKAAQRSLIESVPLEIKDNTSSR